MGDIFGVIFWDFGIFWGGFGVFWGVLGPSVELHWRFCRSLGFFGFFGFLECFGVLEGNFWGEKMSFGVEGGHGRHFWGDILGFGGFWGAFWGLEVLG